MQFKLETPSARWLLAMGLALSAAAANAANGLTVNHAQESLIQVGMSSSAVREALGPPGRVVTFGREPGPTWAYDVAASWDHAVFEIAFDATGRVARVSERELPVE